MIIKLKKNNPNQELIQNARAILEKGGIIVYPTETAYGLGCNGFIIPSIKKIYQIKKRGFNQPLPVIVDSLETAEEIAILNEAAKKLIKKFHPGPLVIALPKKKVIPDELNKNGIAFRISSNIIVQRLLKGLNFPLVSTSANLSGNPTPYSIKEVLNSLSENEIDVIINSGILEPKKPSTIVDFQQKPSPQITRVGEISAMDIFETLKIKKENWNKHIKLSE